MPTTCPSPEFLSDLLEGRLPAEEGARLRTHLADCAACRAVLEQASDDPELREMAARDHRPSPYWREAALARLIEQSAGTSLGSEPMAPAGGLASLGLGPPRVEGDLGTLGGYRILREFGRGGLGVVFEGYDQALGRPVAIKVLRSDRLEGDHRRQLAREARHAARFRHDHVVVVHAVEETADGVPFIVMESIPGPSMADRLRELGRLAPAEAAELIAQAADGLAAAHDSGLIHRDIKPANLLFDPVHRRIRIVDFGLAHAADAPGSLPEGTLVGTPNYMSPEQARGQRQLDAQADQYALGATLYELLTGEPPFHGTPARVIHQVLEVEPRPPRQLNEAIPRDLETICLKAMAKDPRRRYPNVAAMGADLRRWLAGEPIVARPVGPMGRLARWSRRNRRVAALTASTFLLLAALAVGSLFAAARIDRERRSAIAERIRADANAEQAHAAARIAAERARVASEQRTLALETVSTLIKEVQDQLGRSAGTLTLRGRLADAAISRLEKIARDPADDSDVALARVMARERMGELSFLAGRTSTAREHFRAGSDQAAALAGSAGGEIAVEAGRLAAACDDRLGDLALYSADLNEAGSRYRHALERREALPEVWRESPEGRRGRAVSQNKLGDLALRLGRFEEARASYRRGLALTETDRDPDAQRHRFDLRFVHSRLGDLALAGCDFDEAEREYRQALGYAEAQLAAQPDDIRARREVPVCHSRLGALALRRADPKRALESYQKYLDGSEALAAANPSSAEARRDLLVAVSLVADSRLAARDYPAADRDYRRCLDIARALSRDDPGSLQKHMDIDEILTKLADLESRRERFDQAVSWLEQSRTNLRETADAGLIAPDRRASLDTAIGDRLFLCREARRALGDPAWIATQPPEAAKGLWAIRALSLARRGDLRAAAEAAETLRRLAPDDVESLIVAARAYALCLDASSRPASPASPASPAEAAAAPRPRPETYLAPALDALRAALRRRPGLFRGDVLDPDLNPLFAYPEFRRLLTAPAPTPPG